VSQSLVDQRIAEIAKIEKELQNLIEVNDDYQKFIKLGFNIEDPNVSCETNDKRILATVDQFFRF